MPSFSIRFPSRLRLTFLPLAGLALVRRRRVSFQPDVVWDFDRAEVTNSVTRPYPRRPQVAVATRSPRSISDIAL